MTKVLIAPSILSADFSRLGQEIKDVEKAGADWIHIDVMDGAFVPNITIGPVVIKSVRPVTQLPFDVHLMIKSPEDHIESFARAGADIITFHIESEKDPARTVELIRSFKKKVGVSLRPKTPVSDLLDMLPMVDMVLVMTVEPGFGGQQFMPACAEKISELRRVFTKDIQVDGGINASNVSQVTGKGANVIVAGTSVFGAGDYGAAIAGLRRGE